MTGTPQEPMFSAGPFVLLPEGEAPEHFVDEVLLRRQLWSEKRVPDEGEEHVPVGREAVESIRLWLGGGVRPADDLIRSVNPTRPWDIDGLTLVHRLRLHAVLRRNAYWRTAVSGDDLPDDYRQLHEALERTGISEGIRSEVELASLGVHGRATRWRPTFRHPISAWQHHAENPALMRSILGVGSAPDKNQQEMVTAVLGTLIAISEHGPIPYADRVRVAEYAVGPMKAARPLAQRLLRLLPDGAALMSSHLGDKKTDAREESATWIGRYGMPPDAAALRSRLDEEKDAGVRAALLGALVTLGTPAAELLTPEALMGEASGHAEDDASALSWFPHDRIPALSWADGIGAPDTVARWWLLYADDIGDPAGKGLIPRYLDALAPASADALGRAVLDAWIERDTLHPTEEEVRADVDEYYGRVADKMNPDAAPGRTPDARLEYTLRHRHVVYLASAIGHRGLLALATRTEGAWFADRVSRFLRGHRGRRAQAEALLRAAAVHPSDEALHVLLSVARRYRQRTIQSLALELVADVAHRRGWTALQLAARTVPSAGLDDEGRLVLDFGPRGFVAQLNDAVTLTLHDLDPAAPDGVGTARKALPEPAEADDAEMAADAKKEFTAARSELKKIIASQRAQLKDALVVQQRWPAADWRELVAHPIMRRLVAQYLWAAHGDGGDIRLFRLAADGVLRDATDNEAALDHGVELTIAHAAVIDDALLEPWRTPRGALPPQLAVPAVDLADPLRDGADALEDFNGWIIDALTLHGVATKKGYERDQAEDGGIVRGYSKHYEQAQVRAHIEFTGTLVAQREGTVSLHDVRFVRTAVREGKEGMPLALADVPPVLLAEVLADYTAIAAKASVPDPETADGFESA